MRLNTCTELAITKLDVLSPLDELKVCVAYEGDDGTRYDHVPYHQSVLHKVHAGLRDAARVGCEIEHGRAGSTTSRPRRATTCGSSRTSRACRCRSSVGPDRDQTVVLPR